MSSNTEVQEKRVPLMHPSWDPVRKGFIFAVTGSFVLLQILFLANLCYLFGSGFRNSSRTHNLEILMVNYDQGVISNSIRQAYSNLASNTFPTFSEKLPTDYTDPADIQSAVCRGDYWGAIYTHANASERLANALQGGSVAQSYDPTDAITIVWNGIRYPTVAEGNIYLGLEVLTAASRATYLAVNGSAALQSLNSTDAAAAARVLFDPFDYTSINLAPAPQSTRFFLNTASIVMFTLMQFFFILAFNGISNGFQFYTRIPVLTHLSIRLGVSILFTFIGALLSVVYIWAFKESWDVSGGQFMMTWMVLWLVMHINFLVLDAVIATIPITFVPFFTFTWIIVNITSTVNPFEVSTDFYKIGYMFPSHSLWEIFVQIWSRGCYNRLYRTLPILFVWEIVTFPLDIFCQFRKAKAAINEEIEGESVTNQEPISKQEEANNENTGGTDVSS